MAPFGAWQVQPTLTRCHEHHAGINRSNVFGMRCPAGVGMADMAILSLTGVALLPRNLQSWQT